MYLKNDIYINMMITKMINMYKFILLVIIALLKDIVSNVYYIRPRLMSRLSTWLMGKQAKRRVAWFEMPIALNIACASGRQLRLVETLDFDGVHPQNRRMAETNDGGAPLIAPALGFMCSLDSA